MKKSFATKVSRDEIALRSFTVSEGLMMLVLGSLCLIFPLVASIWVTGIVAMVFLIAGLMGGITTICRAPQLGGFHAFWRLVVAALLVFSGIWIVSRLASGPVASASQISALALAIGVVFLVEGAVSTMVAIANRRLRGWGWGLFNGLITLVLGVGILTLKTFNMVSVLGILVGISFLFSGLDLLVFGTNFHSEKEGRRGGKFWSS